MFRDNIKKYAGITFAVLLAIVIAICVFFIFFKFDKIAGFIKLIVGILMPFIYGAVIAYILRPVCNFIEKGMKQLLGKTKLKAATSDKISMWSGIILSLISALLVVYILIVMIVPQIIDTIDSLLTILPQYFNKSVEFIQSLLSKYGKNYTVIEETYQKVYDSAYKWIQTDLVPNIQVAIAGLSTGVVNAVSVVWNLCIGVIVSVYLLYNRKKFLCQFKLVLYSIFTDRWADKIKNELKYTDRMFSGFINGKLIDSLIIGILCYIVLIITNIPYPLLVSVIVGVTNIIPFFGPIIGAVPCVMLIFILNPVKAFYFIIIIILIQFFDGNILGPKILGDATGIDSFWVLFSVMFFGGLFGFVGMVIAVPLFAVIYDILKRLIIGGLKKHCRQDILEGYYQRFKKEPKKEKKKVKIIKK